MSKKKTEREVSPERMAQLKTACLREVEAADREIERAERAIKSAACAATESRPRALARVSPDKAAPPVAQAPTEASRMGKRASLQGALSMSIAAATLRISTSKDAANGDGDGGDEIAATCADAMMLQAFKDLQPTSQIERMLIEQMVMTHAQVIMANHRATGDKMADDRREKALAITSRLMMDFRKTAMTLKEWRAPVRQFIVAQQVNQAGHQTISGPGAVSENPKPATGPTIEVGTQDAP